MNELTTTNFDLPNLDEMNMIMKYCEVVAKAPAYAAMGGMPGVFALIMSARELGLGPMTALNGGLYLIPPGIDKEGRQKGSPTIMMAAKTMSMMIWKAGHKIEEVEVNDMTVTLRGTRADNGVSMTVTMTMEKAKQAQLSHDAYGKPKIWSAWFKNSEDMLYKTCVAKLGRRLFTDVIGNCYEPAEFEEKEAKDIAVKPEKKQLKGKNVPVIEVKEEPELIAYDPTQPSLEEFIEKYGLSADENRKQDPDIMAYVRSCAEKRNKSYDEMVAYCYQNKDGFLNSYRMHAAKEGIPFEEQASS